ncbi:carbohydrate-binding protein [Salegentibacter salinarum]|uniref:Carbohydrate-binding protein n=1 Tax=Salegentibacter salinarum TaxID=447422 RepID=A0A2N0U450_9FLAO|nr:DUF4859 domain-containing protein [Salegentibacter salinarum]PKD21779.1 carbohydrate-binding protein [Salegentibacter salinarum]SKB33706.1 protein of unknown function [Salegentibacter salinarum]
MRLTKNTLLFFFLYTFVSGCSSDDSFVENDDDKENSEEENNEIDPEGDLKIYIPNEFRDMDFDDNASTWSYNRSQESEHFIVFWGAEYGDENPGSENIPEQFRVDIDDLLEKSELFYDLNIVELKFAEVGTGNSKLDEYKMMIFLFHQEEWLATGAGYDDTIGALWVSPNTCQPVGHTIAHEIGHSFQYQVYSDLQNGHGFRYGFGGNGGNSFWEQTAQWQAFQAYPDQVFTAHDFDVYIQNYNTHIHHENYRYASYFIHYYWTSLHGKDFIGRLWKEAEEPEDPIEVYMRLTGIRAEQLNDEIYDAATKLTTWDIDELRELGEEYIGNHKYGYTSLEDGSHMVSPEFAPQTTGYNVIPLNVPKAGTEITVDFTGLPNQTGFNTVDASIAGWRYGFVALREDGTRVYGEMNQGTTAEVNFLIPEDCTNLWFVVTGAPTEYSAHAWDDDNSNDDEWPYSVAFSETNILGVVDFPEDAEREDLTLTYDISFPVNTEAYTGGTVNIDANAIANSFLLQPNEITQQIGNDIQFYAVESSGNLNNNKTANGYGYWFDASGDVINWGDQAVIFSEFDESNFSFNVGQYPGHSITGDSYTIKQALVYEYEPGNSVQATIILNITLE